MRVERVVDSMQGEKGSIKTRRISPLFPHPFAGEIIKILVEIYRVGHGS